MSLTTGQRLGPYEIIGQLGAGGMGEVYRARDTRLQRVVTIKVLPSGLADDPATLGRFEREAQAVAALSHPNILSIHDFGREDGISYAVMELLEGQSLAEALKGGPLPPRKVLDYAKQVADGLAAAHDRGIVHRDIKPANLFINADGRVTILDFGLARMDTGVAAHDSATMAPDTGKGIIVGTIGYMAPEQVRGQAVDHRTDIFALGAVIYEMVSGRRAFAGATPADTLSVILNGDPPELAPDAAGVSPALDRIIRRCLEKEPAHRFQSTRDLGFALDALTTRSTTTAAVTSDLPRRRAVPAGALAAVAIAALAVGVAATMAVMRRSGADTGAPVPVIRFELPSSLGSPPWVAVSPDGQSLAWGVTSGQSNTPGVVVRRLSATSNITVTAADGAQTGLFRQNSKDLVFGRGGELFAADPEANMVTPLLQTPSHGRPALRGAAVGPDDQVLVSLNGDIVRMVAGHAGQTTMVAKPDPAVYAWYAFPQWLPDARRVLFVARRAVSNEVEILVAPLDGGAPVRVELPLGISRVIVDASGAILYARGGTLVAQQFDWQALKPQGEPVTLAAEVIADAQSGILMADVSPSGMLAYRSGGFAQTQFEWVDRSGRTTGTLGPAAPYSNFDLAPDGQRVVTLRRDGPRTSMWLLDGSRNVASMVLDPSSPGVHFLSDPTWSPDGQRVAYRNGPLVAARAVLGGPETVLTNFVGYPDSWSHDGKYLALGRPNVANYDLVAVRADGSGEVIPLVTGVVASDEPRFSPDDKRVAYHATVNGTPQVFVMPFPPTGETLQLSAGGGVQPRWRGDGQELFFLDLEGQVMSVRLDHGKSPTEPAVLFRTGLLASSTNDQFAVRADGQHFLLRRPVAGTDESPVNVILNWRQLLK